MALINKPPSGAVDQGAEMQNPGWASFFSAVFNLLSGLTSSGTTAQRPTTFLFIGRTYFDTSLGAHGKPIWIAKDGVTWILADGTVA